MALNLFAFLSTKSVPTMFWSAQKPLTFRPRWVTMGVLCFGLVIFGLGEAFLIKAGLGVGPWIVLAQGVGTITGWGVGFATFVISVVVLITWIPLRQMPGIGTIMNAVIIAAILAYALPYVPTPTTPLFAILQVLAGILIVGVGSALYLTANLGPGPRDGLMTGLQRRTGLPIGWVRSAIELSVVALGWLLGGTVGIGTVLFAFLIGPAVALCLFVLRQGAQEEAA